MRSRTFLLFSLLFLAFPLLGGDPQSQAVAEPIGVLHLDGEQIEVHSWSVGVTQTLGSATGGGMSVGKVQLQDFHFTKTTDKSSAKLFQACATGQHFPTATFSARKKGQGQQEYMVVKFTDLLVTSYQTGGSGDALPTESISLNYAKIEFVVPGR